MEIRPAIDVAPVRAEYERVAALKTADARAAYVREYFSRRLQAPTAAQVAGLVGALDARGAWVTDGIRAHRIVAPGVMNSDTQVPVRGISTGVFVRNLVALAAWVAGR
jgi:hypothetical protein